MTEKEKEKKKKKKKSGGVVGFFRDFTYGMATHGMARHALKTRSSMEHLFILITMGTCLVSPYFRLTIPSVFSLMWYLRSPHGNAGC